MGNIFKVIKENSIEKLKAELNGDNVNELDKYGRTPLIYAIMNKSNIEIVNLLIEEGTDINIKDKLQDTALTKAIKVNNIEAIEKLLNTDIEINSSEGIMDKPWFLARHNSKIADMLMDKTEGAIRLTLSPEEQSIIDELLYSEEDILENIHKLSSSELIHSFVTQFNWDDDISVMDMILDNPMCKEITAIEMFQLAEGEEILQCEEISPYEEEIYSLVKKITEKFPIVIQA